MSSPSLERALLRGLIVCIVADGPPVEGNVAEEGQRRLPLPRVYAFPRMLDAGVLDLKRGRGCVAAARGSRHGDRVRPIRVLIPPPPPAAVISARRHGWRVRRACVFGEWQRSVFKVHAFIWVKTARSRVAAQGKFGPMGCQEYMWVFFPPFPDCC